MRSKRTKMLAEIFLALSIFTGSITPIQAAKHFKSMLPYFSVKKKVVVNSPQPVYKATSKQELLALCVEMERRTNIDREIYYRIAKKESNFSLTDPDVVASNNFLGLSHYMAQYHPSGVKGYMKFGIGDGMDYCIFNSPFDCFFTLGKKFVKKNVKSLDDLYWYNPGNKRYIQQLKNIVIPDEDIRYMDSISQRKDLPAKPMEKALSLIGSKYVYGTSGPYTFDCSGFVQTVYPQLPRTSRAQREATKLIAKEQVQIGDLAFFGDPVHHVGVVSYVGDTIKIIHAKGTGYTVCEEPLTQSWLKTKLTSFGRI